MRHLSNDKKEHSLYVTSCSAPVTRRSWHSLYILIFQQLLQPPRVVIQKIVRHRAAACCATLKLNRCIQHIMGNTSVP